MNHLEGTKTVAKVASVTTDGGAFTHEIDTYGADYVSVDVVYSTFTAASTAYATLKVQHSDASGSGQTDVLTTTAVAGLTTGNHVARFNVDMRGKKRYLTVVGNPAKPATVCSVARLSKMEDEPYNAATAGVSNYVSG